MFYILGNPGLAYCTICSDSFNVNKHYLGKHQLTAKHIKRAGLTPDEVQDLMKKSEKGKLKIDPVPAKKYIPAKNYRTRFNVQWCAIEFLHLLHKPY